MCCFWVVKGFKKAAIMQEQNPSFAACSFKDRLFSFCHFCNSSAMCLGVRIRPYETTFSLMTSPGVCIMPYFAISYGSSTLMMVASMPIFLSASTALTCNFSQFRHPGPNILISISIPCFRMNYTVVFCFAMV